MLRRQPVFRCFFVGSRLPGSAGNDKVLICEIDERLPEPQSQQFEPRGG